jgi:hypothetical protein
VGVSVGDGIGVGVSVGSGVGVSVGNGVGVDVSVGIGVDVPSVLVGGSAVAVILSASLLPGNAAVADVDRVSRSANSPLTTTSRKAKMKRVRHNIWDAFLVPSCFTVTPAPFLPHKRYLGMVCPRLRLCNDSFLAKGYLLLSSINNFHAACFHYERQAGTKEG